MVSANVLYMIWEQIVFQERRIFLFTPTREEQVWVGGSEGGPMGTELPWALSRTRWAMPPSPKHLVQRCPWDTYKQDKHTAQWGHTSSRQGFPAKTGGREWINGWAGCVVLKGKRKQKAAQERQEHIPPEDVWDVFPSQPINRDTTG